MEREVSQFFGVIKFEFSFVKGEENDLLNLVASYHPHCGRSILGRGHIDYDLLCCPKRCCNGRIRTKVCGAFDEQSEVQQSNERCGGFHYSCRPHPILA